MGPFRAEPPDLEAPWALWLETPDLEAPWALFWAESSDLQIRKPLAPFCGGIPQILKTLWALLGRTPQIPKPLGLYWAGRPESFRSGSFMESQKSKRVHHKRVHGPKGECRRIFSLHPKPKNPKLLDLGRNLGVLEASQRRFGPQAPHS